MVTENVGKMSFALSNCSKSCPHETNDLPLKYVSYNGIMRKTVSDSRDHVVIRESGFMLLSSLQCFISHDNESVGMLKLNDI